MATAKKTSKAPAKSRIPVRKPVPKKAAARPVAKAVAPTVSTRPVPAKAVDAPKGDKPKKAKLVRDSFTIPKSEYTVLQDLKLRAGIKALAAMNDAAFAAALGAVPPIKTGRPAKD